MNTKICTSIEQSEKLLSLGLDPSTADMYYCIWRKPFLSVGSYERANFINGDNKAVPAWSITALLELMPPYLFEWERGIDLNIYPNNFGKGWYVSYMSNNTDDMQKDKFRQITNGNSPLEAAFEMVCWLIEQRHIKVNK